MTALIKLTRARTRLLLHSPFFSTLVLKLKLVEDNKQPTMATDGYSIVYNTEFVDSLSQEECMGVLCHETAHCMFMHMTRRNNRDPVRWNVAGDYVINSLILDEFNMILPSDRLYDPKYRGMSAEAVYAQLPENPQEPRWGLVNDGNGEMSDEQLETEWVIATKAAAERAKAAGELPGSLGELIDKAQARVNWREQLNRGMTSMAKTDYSWYPPNIQYIQHKLHIPTLNEPSLGHIVLAIDTSGSVDNRQLSQFMGELQYILDTIHFESITVIQCDTEIKHIESFESGEYINAEVHGRGGTRFGPVFDHCDTHRPDILIYCTDMEPGDRYPAEPSYPVYWARTADIDAPWGTHIDLFRENP